MKPFNQLYDIPKNIEYPHSKEIEDIVGLRINKGMAIDQPCELGYHCPVCKYEMITNGNFDERLTWSEYNGFLFCYVCNRDYPSFLCQPDIDKAIENFLSFLKSFKDRN
jgi:hypothetical protein